MKVCLKKDWRRRREGRRGGEEKRGEGRRRGEERGGEEMLDT